MYPLVVVRLSAGSWLFQLPGCGWIAQGCGSSRGSGCRRCARGRAGRRCAGQFRRIREPGRSSTAIAQFRSTALARTLHDHGLTGSTGWVGACGDNAAMESFFALLQKNDLDRHRWPDREQLRLAIITWIERTYHRRRRQRRLGRLTPIQYETINQTANAA